MEFSLLNDEPVAGPEADPLDTGRAARQLAKLLHDSRSATPLTLAVDAGWGMGKSSLMRLVETELRLSMSPGNRTHSRSVSRNGPFSSGWRRSCPPRSRNWRATTASST
ncbi:P-loop NTPase fold protein [Streptomyces sp. NPDC007157]|uniref:P-loop NTPase fold protein n=1 Tax=Streptomyces sp. NPDC007157 TaxID=3154681 RepID=UPI0033CB166E